MAQPPYLSTDPNEGTPVASDYVSTDPTEGTTPARHPHAVVADLVADVGLGALKGVGQTVANLGELVHNVPGVSAAIDAFYGRPGLSVAMFGEASRLLAPTSTAQSVGKGAEQIGEYLIPGTAVSKATKGLGLLPRIAAEAGLGAGVAVAQKTDPTTGAVLGAAGPVVGRAAGPVAEYIGSKAVPLVRAGVKAPLSLLKQQAGASMTGVNFQANRLAKFIVDNRLSTPGQAARIIKNTEAELQRILATKGQVPTDAPARALLYLDLLEQKAAQALTPDHAATIRAAAAELIEASPLGETITRTVMRPSPTGLVTASGQPVLVPTRQTSRALRADVPAAEALDIARTTSRFETRRSWGEQKGTALEATKTEERAVRDALKVALPEARTPLQRQGMAILAQQALDRQLWREANRDALSLPGLVGANASAVLGFAAHWLRNNQRRAGIWADQLSKAIQSQDAATTAAILHRLSVPLGGQLTRPPGPAGAAR